VHSVETNSFSWYNKFISAGFPRISGNIPEIPRKGRDSPELFWYQGRIQRRMWYTYRGVDLKKTRFVPGGFSCTNSPTSCSGKEKWMGTTETFLVHQKRKESFPKPSLSI